MIKFSFDKTVTDPITPMDTVNTNEEEDDDISIKDHISFTIGSVTLLIQSVVAGVAVLVRFKC